MEPEEKSRRKSIISVVFLFLGNVLFFLTIWLLQKYDKVCIDQFLFQMKTSSSGVHRTLAGSAVVRVGLFSVIATMLEVFLYQLLSGRMREKMKKHHSYIVYCTTKICSFFKRRSVSLSVSAFGLGAMIFVTQMDVPAYLGKASKESDFIEDHYVDPGDVKLKFPEEKRNLIYIFLESMENTYADTDAGGKIITNYIPELTDLAGENVSFSNKEGIGGAFAYSGTTWTAAAMVTQTCGVPVKVELTADAYGAEDVFLPGVTAIGDILEKEGYQQTLLVGSDAEFHGREPYFVQHGDYTVVDTVSLKNAGRLAQDYEEWWGFEDEKLFVYAKEELTRLAAEGEPFNLTMLTVDTHFPDGYECHLCQDVYEEQYANVLACSSRQVSEFVGWIKEQPFYENTTIIISGDHPTMDSEFLEDIDEDYVRTIYNCIINAPIHPEREKNRAFGTFDMFPTTLAAMGVEIEGDRLGLGTNLFSGEKTLTEQYGFEALEEELQKTSEFYNIKFLELPDERYY